MILDFLNDIIYKFVKRLFSFIAITLIIGVNFLPFIAFSASVDEYLSNLQPTGQRFFSDTLCQPEYNCLNFEFTPTHNYSVSAVYLPLMQNTAETVPANEQLIFEAYENGILIASYSQDINSLPTGTWNTRFTYGCTGSSPTPYYSDKSCFAQFDAQIDFDTANNYNFYVYYDYSLGFFPPKVFAARYSTSAIGEMIVNGDSVYYTFDLFIPPPPSNQPIEIDILGSTSPSDIINSVTTGVTTTGQSSWPLLSLLGVPTSFIIGRYVVGFIRAGV